MTLLEQLRDQRGTARAAADDILTRAASENREPSPDELAQYQLRAGPGATAGPHWATSEREMARNDEQRPGCLSNAICAGQQPDWAVVAACGQ